MFSFEFCAHPLDLETKIIPPLFYLLTFPFLVAAYLYIRKNNAQLPERIVLAIAYTIMIIKNKRMIGRFIYESKACESYDMFVAITLYITNVFMLGAPIIILVNPDQQLARIIGLYPLGVYGLMLTTYVIGYIIIYVIVVYGEYLSFILL